MKTYPIAPNGIFRTIQGEGALLGVPMTFLRLAGCSVGCPGCDTDYHVAERLSVQEIGERIRSLGVVPWVWVTGGEPADHDLWPLLEEVRLCGRIALATSGHKSLGAGGRLIDFLSVSPHGKPDELILTRGSQLNLVPGLNGLKLADWSGFDASGFLHKWATPFWYGPSDRMESVTSCLDFIRDRADWRLGLQAHKFWGLP